MKKIACEDCGKQHDLALGEFSFPVTDCKISIDDEVCEVKLTDCEFMASQFPETFQRPSADVCKNIPVGMMLKVVVEWPIQALPAERFWVEVTSIEQDKDGYPVYFGELRNRTLLADFGERMGPIYPRNVADVDLDAFLEKHGLSRELMTAEGAE
jgi:hypothetical protein